MKNYESKEVRNNEVTTGISEEETKVVGGIADQEEKIDSEEKEIVGKEVYDEEEKKVSHQKTLIVGFIVAIVIIVAIISIFLLISSNGKQNSEEVNIISTNFSGEQYENITKETEEKIANDDVDITLPDEEDSLYSTAEEWVDSLELKSPTILIWNSITLDNVILENGQEYQLKEGDQILLSTSARFDDFRCTPTNIFEGFEPKKQKYVEIFLNIEGKQEVTLEIEIDGEKYANTVTFIGISGENTETVNVEEEISTKESIDLTSNLQGEEWIISIGNKIEEPFIAIWNDTEKTKKILDEGESYQLKNNDVFFVYIPSNCIFYGMDPFQLSVETVTLENGLIIKIDRSYILNETTVKIVLTNLDDMSKEEISCILTVS